MGLLSGITDFLFGGNDTPAAPAPDPNIGIAQKEMADISREYLNFYKTVLYPEASAVVNKQEARADEQWAFDRELATWQRQIAEEEYARLKEKFYPLQDQLIEDAKNYNTVGERERQAALAMGDTRDQFAQVRDNARMNARSYGIDPTSGRYQGMDRAMDVMEAGTAAAAATRARTAAEQLGWAKRMDAIGLGMGQFGNQATSTGLALNAGNSALNAGQTSVANNFGLASSAAQGYALPMQGWSNVGNLGVQNYGIQSNNWYRAAELDRQSRADTMGFWGSLAGAGAYYGKK